MGKKRECLTLVFHADAACEQGGVGAGLGHFKMYEDVQENISIRECADVEESFLFCSLHRQIATLLFRPEIEGKTHMRDKQHRNSQSACMDCMCVDGPSVWISEGQH